MLNQKNTTKKPARHAQQALKENPTSWILHHKIKFFQPKLQSKFPYMHVYLNQKMLT
jgi:hypothetical protein